MPPASPPTLSHAFADDLPELALAWRAAEAPTPQLLLLEETLAADLGLDPAWLRTEDGLGFLLGTAVAPGSAPVAQAYAGHQFGGYSPRLGDGRALLLGEIEVGDGTLRDLHLKGSGRTPFSRGGDGFAAVGPMLREFVMAESMHALGVPTTRSLAVVATGRPVHRQEGPLPGAVLTRVARSHLRVGTFQYAAANGDPALMTRLVDHAIARHYPEIEGHPEPARALFAEVVQAQADLLAQWMLVGFVHGVMNTDNTTISGETIDYGPCAFMEVFDPAVVFSSIDADGRYAYGRQPEIAEWNLARLAEALLPLIDDDQTKAIEIAVEELGRFRTRYAATWSAGMRRKLGLPSGLEEAVVHDLVNEVLGLIRGQADYTSFFRALARDRREGTSTARDLVLEVAAYDAWFGRWAALSPDPDVMDRVNPVYIPRNHLVEEALVAGSAGDLAPAQALLDVLRDPFTERPGLERFAEPAPESFGAYTTFCGT